MVSFDTAGMKELDVLSKDIEDLKQLVFYMFLQLDHFKFLLTPLCFELTCDLPYSINISSVQDDS
jgi:hypothetical protein